MKNKLKLIMYYILVTIFSFIISIHYLYDQPFYYQLLAATALIVIAIMTSRYVDINYYLFFSYIFIIIIFLIAAWTLYNGYRDEQSIIPPVIKTPDEDDLIGYYPIGYQDTYYKDDQFEGYINYSLEDIRIFNIEEERIDVIAKTKSEPVYDEILSVQYSEGLIYVQARYYYEKIEGEFKYHEDEIGVFIYDINTLELVKSVIDERISNGYTFCIDGKLYISSYNRRLDSIDSEFNFGPSNLIELDENEIIVNASQYKHFYLFTLGSKNRDVVNRRLVVYDQDFNFVTTLEDDAKNYTFSEDLNGNLLIGARIGAQSDGLYDLYFHTYNQQLSLTSTNLIKEDVEIGFGTNMNGSISAIHHNDYYFVEHHAQWKDGIYSSVEVYDEEFNIVTPYLVDEENYFERIFIPKQSNTETFYVAVNSNLYKMSIDDYIITENDPYTFTYRTPFTGVLFYCSILFYPLMLLNRQKDKK